MRVDLHCHTNCSDGELTPQQLLALAREREIDLLSITDHDTLAAYDGCLEDTAAKGAQNAIGPRIVKGIELSAVWRKSTVHVVGLNLDIEHPQLRAAVASQRNARAQRLSTILQRLKKQGVDISEQQVHDQCGHATPGRPHIAQLMVDLGYVSKVATAFDRYLGQGKVGDVKESWPALDTVVRWIVDSQGVAVLAHPLKYRFTQTRLRDLVTEFKQSGGQALEVISGQQTPSQTQQMVALANRFDLHGSCGSDFHRPNQAWAALGMVAPLPDSIKPVWTLWEDHSAA